MFECWWLSIFFAWIASLSVDWMIDRHICLFNAINKWKMYTRRNIFVRNTISRACRLLSLANSRTSNRFFFISKNYMAHNFFRSRFVIWMLSVWPFSETGRLCKNGQICTSPFPIPVGVSIITVDYGKNSDGIGTTNQIYVLNYICVRHPLPVHDCLCDFYT